MFHHRSYSDDKSSMPSTYNSTEKTPLTVFSHRSSPPQSRSQSPVRLSIRQKPQPFCSEERKSILPLRVSTSGLSDFEGRAQSVPVNASWTEASQCDLASFKRNEATEIDIFERGDNSMLVEPTADNNQTFLSLDTIGGMFDKLDGPSVGESGFFSCSDDSSDEDLDLEQSADKFLSEKFGISLSRLRRPHRIIYAFQQVKKQCVGILEDEGHHFVGSPRSEDSQSEPVDGDTYQSPAGDRAYSIPGSASTLAGIKRPSHDTIESQGLWGPNILAKTRRHKKRRIEGDFSCPYRKRNPRRFNVRDHEECANRSYKDISALKKHITAYHCREEARVCGRCNQAYGTQDALVAHLGQCDHPPLSRPPIRYIDPEDGVDYRTENILKSRKLVDQINNWDTLWKLLFPADASVPCSDFEPVVEDHDIIYNYKCSQSQISQRLDALDLEPSCEQVKALCFEVIESLLRCGGTSDQYPTPSSNASTSQTQSRSRKEDVATLDRESGSTANPIGTAHITAVCNPEETSPLMNSGAQNSSDISGLTQLSSTDITRQSLTHCGPPVILDNRGFVGLLPESTQLYGVATPRTFDLTHSGGGLESFQSTSQLQPTLLCEGTSHFSQNMCSQVPQGGYWIPNDIYSSIESDHGEQWTDFSGIFEHDNVNDPGC